MDNRYFFTKMQGDRIFIQGGEAQHLSRVRRCKVGDEIVAFNGDGFDYNLEVVNISKDEVACEIIGKQLNKASNDQEITVYLAMIKNEALCEAIDCLAELNVKNVKLFKSDYSVAVIDDKKLEKLRNIAIQASKQCERADIMNISIIDKKNIQNDIAQIENVFFAYENSTNKISKFSGNFAVIIGPEGGFSDQENQLFSMIAKNVTLSKTILRAQVACVCAVSALKAVSCEG